MANVTVAINQKTYVLGCEDGGEAHLRALARRVDTKVRQIDPTGGPSGDTRLMLMAALMVSDDLQTAEARLVRVEARLAALEIEFERLESIAVEALTAAAARLEAMAPE